MTTDLEKPFPMEWQVREREGESLGSASNYLFSLAVTAPYHILKPICVRAGISIVLLDGVRPNVKEFGLAQSKLFAKTAENRICVNGVFLSPIENSNNNNKWTNDSVKQWYEQWQCMGEYGEVRLWARVREVGIYSNMHNECASAHHHNTRDN